MKICESCVHRLIVDVEEAPLGVNPDNKRVDQQGNPFYLFCTYFYSFPSANLRLNCSQHTSDPKVAPVAR